jgi:gamma-glutamyltranspeptidase/glutathione hydrolase
MMCGLGGDAFAILFDAQRREVVGFNGSGASASGAKREYYTSRMLASMPSEGVHSVTVPGAVSLYETIWKRYGSISWAELWAPAVQLAEDGIAITEHVSQLIRRHAEFLRSNQYASAQFLPNGRPPVTGERWAAPNLARTLRAIANHGAETFYSGEIADKIVSFLSREGALFTVDDFARQKTDVYTPIATTYRGVTVYETAPPSQGYLVLQQLNIIEGFDLARIGPSSPDRIHLFVEAKKLAFADHNKFAADPALVRWPLDQLISKEHAAINRQRIDMTRTREVEPLQDENSGETSYFAVADGEGNAISFIHSLSGYFGSGLVAEETGVTLNNRGRGFRLERDHPNVIEPRKRPINTLNCYLLCRDGRPWIIGGTPGGDQQVQWNVQTITNLLDHGMTLQQAVEAPRWFSFPGYPEPAGGEQQLTLRLERRISESTQRELADRGHVIETLGSWGSGGAAQLVELDQVRGVLRGATDPRAAGLALGF